MLEHILESKVKTKIVRLFAERNEAFHVSAVARALQISKSRASECLRELAEKGVLESQVIGRNTIYKPASTNFAKTVFKAVTQEKSLLGEIEKDVLSETKKLKTVSLVLFGSALGGLKIGSDIDFLLLYDGKVDKNRIYEICAELTEKFGFHISILTMEVREFKAKARRGEEFVLNIMANHKVLYGKNLEKVVWQEK